jgi:hypothetical protein
MNKDIIKLEMSVDQIKSILANRLDNLPDNYLIDIGIELYRPGLECLEISGYGSSVQIRRIFRD